jgi:hypothetical protein
MLILIHDDIRCPVHKFREISIGRHRVSCFTLYNVSRFVGMATLSTQQQLHGCGSEPQTESYKTKCQGDWIGYWMQVWHWCRLTACCLRADVRMNETEEQLMVSWKFKHIASQTTRHERLLNDRCVQWVTVDGCSKTWSRFRLVSRLFGDTTFHCW